MSGKVQIQLPFKYLHFATQTFIIMLHNGCHSNATWKRPVGGGWRWRRWVAYGGLVGGSWAVVQER